MIQISLFFLETDYTRIDHYVTRSSFNHRWFPQPLDIINNPNDIILTSRRVLKRVNFRTTRLRPSDRPLYVICNWSSSCSCVRHAYFYESKTPFSSTVLRWTATNIIRVDAMKIYFFSRISLVRTNTTRVRVDKSSKVYRTPVMI